MKGRTDQQILKHNWLLKVHDLNDWNFSVVTFSSGHTANADHFLIWEPVKPGTYYLSRFIICLTSGRCRMGDHPIVWHAEKYLVFTRHKITLKYLWVLHVCIFVVTFMCHYSFTFPLCSKNLHVPHFIPTRDCFPPTRLISQTRCFRTYRVGQNQTEHVDVVLWIAFPATNIVFICNCLVNFLLSSTLQQQITVSTRDQRCWSLEVRSVTLLSPISQEPGGNEVNAKTNGRMGGDGV